MGTWGFGSFENDDAADWLYDLEESHDLSVIEETFALADSGEIEAPDGCAIIAAAEIVLALKGHVRDELSDDAVKWIEAHADLNVDGIKSTAIEAVNAVTSQHSELNELWAESDEYEAWLENVNDLKERLAKG